MRGDRVAMDLGTVHVDKCLLTALDALREDVWSCVVSSRAQASADEELVACHIDVTKNGLGLEKPSLPQKASKNCAVSTDVAC